MVCWGKQACLCADTFPSAHSLFWVAAAAKKSIKQENHFCLAWASKAIFTAALLLLSLSCLSDCRMNAEPSKSPHAAALARAYILVCHFPVRPLAVGHHLPHHNAVAPDIAGRCEFAEGDCFRCCPSDGDLPSLEGKEKEKNNPKNRLQRRAKNMQKRTKQHFLEHRGMLFSLWKETSNFKVNLFDSMGPLSTLSQPISICRLPTNWLS